jgi:hypothetical protein
MIGHSKKQPMGAWDAMKMLRAEPHGTQWQTTATAT